MGSDKNKNQQPSPGAPRDEMRNQVNYQNQRFESQQAPLVDTASYNYGRSSEADYGNYTDMMNNYRDLASGGGGQSGGGGGGGGGEFNGSYNPYLVSPERVSAERAGQQTATNRSLGPLERVTAQQLNPMERVSAGNGVTAGKLGNNIERVTASDPFKSYGGYEEFSKTGGYSGQDIADMRARGIAPIRAAYANAARNVGQQRSLQGGYSPNAIAAQVKMAREQGQGMADASQNVDAGIAQARNAGRLAGLGGMSGIEGNRLNAQMQGDIFNAGQANQGRQFDISNQLGADQFNAGQQLDASKFNSNQAFQGNQFDISNRLNADQYNSGQAFAGQQFDINNDMNTSQFNAGQGNQIGMFNAGQANNMGQFNANLNYQGQTYNADAQRAMQSQQNAAGASNAAARAAANQQDTATRLAALGGMQNLYGTTPGASQLFGNQALSAVNTGANQGIGMVNGTNLALNQPGAFEQTMDRTGQIINMAGAGANAYNTIFNNPQQQQPTGGIGPTTPPYVPPNGGYSNGNISFQQPSFGYQQPSVSQQRNYFGGP